MHCTMSTSALVCAYAIDHVEPEPEIKKEQIQGVFGGPQATSARILTLLLDQSKPRCITPHTFMLRMIVH
jgi:hypothetical protein